VANCHRTDLIFTYVFIRLQLHDILQFEVETPYPLTATYTLPPVGEDAKVPIGTRVATPKPLI
jgi:hypothetical protein